MSIEIFALSNRRVASFESWQRQIDIEQLRLLLPAEHPIDELRGFLPVQLEGMASGFECSHCDPREIVKLYPDVDLGAEWTEAIAFNSHGFDEGLAAYQAAAAYAQATDGVVFDPQESLVMSPQQAFGVAQRFKAEIPNMKESLETALARQGLPSS
jgi:hypothetical protein